MCSKLCCKGERSHQTMGARYGAYYMDQQVIGHKGAVHTQSHTPTHKYMTTKIHLRASSTATRVRPISQVILFERTCRLSKDIMGDILQVLILFVSPPPPPFQIRLSNISFANFLGELLNTPHIRCRTFQNATRKLKEEQ